MVKFETRKFRFFNNDTEEFEDIPFIDRWDFEVEGIGEKLSAWWKNEDVIREKAKKFDEKISNILASQEFKEDTIEFLAEVGRVPVEEAKDIISGKIKVIEQELGEPITPGIFFMQLYKRKHGFIQHNQHPTPSLSLHFFMQTPIDTVEFLECNNYSGNQAGGCHNRDWGQMAHRERTITCMVDEETGEKVCDTMGNLASEAYKFPYRLLRGTTNNQEIIRFLFGQEQLKEMLKAYEEFMAEEE